jgi:RNA polymerase sigma-70 factor, ECF subfamily
MNTAVISENSFEAGWVGRCDSFELVKAFGDRIYSIAKLITQNDHAAEKVLVETFLEVGSDLDGYQADEKVWLRLVTLAVREALSTLHSPGHGHPRLDQVADSDEDLVVREFYVWGDEYRHYSRERTTSVLEHGLRSLAPMCRTVFVLREIEDISVEHIAMIVDRSIAAVDVCLLRARLELRETLTRQIRQQR